MPPLQRREDTARLVCSTSNQVSPRGQRAHTQGKILEWGMTASLVLAGPCLTQIMEVIQGCQNKLIDCFEELKVEFFFMKHDVQKLREKVQATEHRIATLEDTVRPMSTDVQVIKKTLSEQTKKMAHMEDRMRRNNMAGGVP